ncbi:ABC transporter permease [Peptidiphaga gingivicola]|uniref:ABC transporter permease n=1 Tax=Peptidiphaga gingivicola TaxID=2741497 RepID=A0A179B2Z3_9ACTO|nr:ABC transporter permease [Peptidiphaga gingivicola]OAP86062.1 ABC transporter permease [Peptidiphaga gingivicola]
MNNLVRLIGRRLVALPIMVLGVTFLVFFLMSFSKIDEAYTALGEGASQKALEEYRESHGLNDPFFVRYGSFLWNFFTKGDLGSYGANRAPVSDRVAEAFPVTLQLTFLGLLIAVVISVFFGVVAALYRDRWPDKAIRVFSIAAIATPSFWLGVLLILAFAINSPIFDVSGELVPFSEDPGAWLNRMLLPAFALGVPVAGSLTRVIRTAVVEELDKDYVRTAIGAGIPKRVVVSRNVLRNALITPITVLGLRIGYLMGGAVVIEIIFNLNGMGRAILEGVKENYPALVQGVTLIVALSFIVVNILVDMLYVLVNPRIREV